MSQPVKPREFWIDSLPIFNGDDIVSWKRAYTNEQDGFEKHKGNELYHVIEYSAYAKLKAQNNKLIKALMDCIHTLENSKCDEPEWARGSIALGKEALKEVGEKS